MTKLANEADLLDPRAAELTAWLLDVGLQGVAQLEMLEGYCNKLVELGVPLMRVHVTHQAFHPSYGGIGFDWERDEGVSRHTYEHVDNAPDVWLVSPFFHMLKNNLAEYREQMHVSKEPSRFPLLNEMRGQGATDYFAAALLFEQHDFKTPIDPHDTPEGALVSWMANGPEGFAEADIRLIKAVYPCLGLVLKAASNRQMAQDLLGVYLGSDAGARVLSGEIRRGSSQRIDAVICYFDLEGFTSLSQRIAGEAMIAMLNDYFGVAVTLIEGRGGNVLKYMGDGLLAIFDRRNLPDAADAALAAVRALREGMAARTAEREADGLPTAGYTLALHAGEVLYGNIGAEERLDFTVIGPAVNLTARLSGLHRSLGRDVIVSQAVVRQATPENFDLVSLGRYMVRGVDEPQELFTIYDGSS